jgi:hypothetical protein
MAKERFWYTANKKIGIVEKDGTTVTVDDVTSSYKSISEAKTLRLFVISMDDDLGSTLSDDSFSLIPGQFHEAIVFKAIAYGYLDPRNMEMNNAANFNQMYDQGVKKAKNYVRSQNITTGQIIPQDF